MAGSQSADGSARARRSNRAASLAPGGPQLPNAAGAPALTEPDPWSADLEAARGAPPGIRRQADLAVSVVGQLFRLAPRLVDIQDIGARDYGLGFARGRVLWALLESGPVLMRALSEALRISPRTVTGLVDALEADGWVTRSPHPADRRATIISLAPVSELTLARLRDSYEALAGDLLGDQSDDDLARCWQVISTLEERLDRAVASRIAAFEGSAEDQSRAGRGGRRARS